MIDLRTLDKFRHNEEGLKKLYPSWTDPSRYGAFMIPYPRTKIILFVMASNDQGWDHVSASTKHRCPDWFEMSYLYQTFFKSNEAAYQLHVPSSDHVNFHNYTLHLWRPHNARIPLPPKVLV